MEQMKTLELKFLITILKEAFFNPKSFVQRLPNLSPVTSVLPLFILTIFNSVWIIGMATRVYYMKDGQKRQIVNILQDPFGTLVFIGLIIILMFLALMLVIGTEAAILRVLTQAFSSSSSRRVILSMSFKDSFIMTSHAHLPFLVESVTMGIIFNSVMIGLNINIIVDFGVVSRKIIHTTSVMSDEAFVLTSILPLVIFILLLISLGLSSYLIYRFLACRNDVSARGIILKVLILYNLVKFLLILIAPIPMML